MCIDFIYYYPRQVLILSVRLGANAFLQCTQIGHVCLEIFLVFRKDLNYTVNAESKYYTGRANSTPRCMEVYVRHKDRQSLILPDGLSWARFLFPAINFNSLVSFMLSS